MKQMMMIDRRMLLRGAASATAALTVPSVAKAQTVQGDALLFTISDLHAPYSRLPALLDTIKTRQAETGLPSALLLNGDVFERGNVVCLRSGGAADWAFLSAVAAEMPVYINLGNHETAILDDMATFLARADQAGVRVISNLVDRRTGRFLAPVADRFGLGGIEISLLGLAATNPFVYRQPVRDTLTFLDTTQFVADAFADTSAGAAAKIIMSHAGVAADRAFLGSLPAGSLVQGAHDHLSFDTVANGVTYVHGSSWGTALGMVTLTRGSDGVGMTYQKEPIAPGGGDAALAELIAAQKAEHLTEADREVLTTLPDARDMHQSILLATEAVRQATNADLAMIGHTTFGAPLAAGPLTRYDFDAYIRFGGGLQVATVPGSRLADILQRTNQFAADTLEQRTGDYLHVAEIDIDPSRSYRLAVNGWTAMNQQSYMGTDDLEFAEIEGLELKGVVADFLRATFG